jgi:hypothetical protein
VHESFFTVDPGWACEGPPGESFRENRPVAAA